MSDRLERIENKLDMVVEKLSDVRVETAANTASLKEHMEQTILVREQTEALKTALVAHVEVDQTMHDKFNTFMDRAKWSGTIFVSSAAVVGFLYKVGWLSGLIALLYRWTNHS